MRPLFLFSLILLGSCAPSQPKPSKKIEQATGAAYASATLQAPVTQSPVAPASKPSPTAHSAQSTKKRATPSPSSHRPAPATRRYLAVGTEPFWAVRAVDDGLILTRPDMPPRHFFASLTGKGNIRRYIGPDISITISPGPCSDGMSDTLYPDHVRIALDEGVLKGCGGSPLKNARGE